MSSSKNTCNNPRAILPEDAVLTSAEERKFNRLSSVMEQFHNHFRHEFNDIYDLADGKFERRGMSLSMYLAQIVSFKRHLEGHHGIEEAYIFPRLAMRMKEFDDDEKHKNSHKGIHDGLDKLSELIHKWRLDASSYSPTELRACLDTWRDVLFRHLDEEVVDLKGSNMRKYWSLEEMDQFMV
ncbi:hypothetical protein EXIGLDRAFT_716458 [Exidia glandulosa HHB12029]|uniref:Hemerythrin-like domain-containing protein n=1 Tax=Exidia glandulosa HHB12029 TaxID=1314781 RepID=A0A166BK20_EXIGL|nr:hypothetical protein EXIGLDRAFT_716458 [Exidia glandulosa HHB12029]